jgi:ABC-type phosphate transport system substrate-binding protein
MISRATFFLVGATASTVWAANGPDTTGNNIALQGSDTLEEVTKAVLADPTCAASLTGLGITYAGGGSGTGETAMATSPATQKVAPMSRFIQGSTAVCGANSNAGTTAQGLVIGLDGVALLASQTNGQNACGGSLANSGSFSYTDPNSGPTNYTISESSPGAGDAWRDVLKLVYFGKDHTGTTACGGPIRKALVASWATLFQGGACTSGTCPTGLKHAYRRGDTSGTTDVFLSSLGLGGLASAQIAQTGAKANPFCNATGLPATIFGGQSDYVDQDPLRVPCDTIKDASGNLMGGDQVCSRNNGVGGPVGTPGTLGLVQVVEIPTNLSVAQMFTTALCDAGKFATALPKAAGDPAALPSPPCPNGGPLTLGRCYQPYIDLGGGAKNFNCVARVSPVQGIARNGMTDGRAYNLWIKDSTGKLLKDGFTVPSDPTNFPTNPATTQRLVTGGFFRTHMSIVANGGGTTCQDTDSTAQIGCLTQADPCTIGFAGREAATGGSIALNVNGVSDQEVNIVKLLAPAGSADFAARYPMSRKLFFNTLVGFPALTPGSGEAALAKCFATNAIVDPIMSSHNFIPMSHTTAFNAAGSIFCQDFDETAPLSTGCGFPGTNSNSCASLPAGFIQ